MSRPLCEAQLALDRLEVHLRSRAAEHRVRATKAVCDAEENYQGIAAWHNGAAAALEKALDMLLGHEAD